MATLLSEQAPVDGLFEVPPVSVAKKKTSSTGLPSAHGLVVNPSQHQGIRFVSFMLENSKHEITPADFLAEALARHFQFYQAKRGLEFPPKMFADLTSRGMVTGKPTGEE